MNQNKQEAIQMYRNGLENVQEIARELQLSPVAVYKYLQEETAKARQERNEQVVKLYKEGMMIDEILEKVGISVGTLYKILRDEEVELRTDTYKERAMDDDKIVEMYINREPVYKILEESKRSGSYLYRLLRRREIPLRQAQ